MLCLFNTFPLSIDIWFRCSGNSFHIYEPIVKKNYFFSHCWRLAGSTSGSIQENGRLPGNAFEYKVCALHRCTISGSNHASCSASISRPVDWNTKNGCPNHRKYVFAYRPEGDYFNWEVCRYGFDYCSVSFAGSWAISPYNNTRITAIASWSSARGSIRVCSSSRRHG